MEFTGFNSTSELAELFVETRKIGKDYGFSDVVSKLFPYSRASIQYCFIYAWQYIPDDFLYEEYRHVLSDVTSNYYLKLFKPELVSKVKAVNKRDTVENPLLQAQLDSDGFLTIYHGHAKKSMRGSYSWTTEPEIAHFFGCRNSRIQNVDDYYVVTGKAGLDDVIAYITDRSEAEIVVLNKDVKQKTKTMFKRSETNDIYKTMDAVWGLINKRKAKKESA